MDKAKRLRKRYARWYKRERVEALEREYREYQAKALELAGDLVICLPPMWGEAGVRIVLPSAWPEIEAKLGPRPPLP